MAETKRRGRPKKVETPVETEEKKVDNSQDELIKKLMAQLEEQNAKMAEMQKQIEDNNKPQTVVVNNENTNMRSKKVKVVNLMHNPLNISTEPNGKGRIYAFRDYGDSKLIKYDDLVEILSSYPNTMEKGYAYICDKEAVESLGLIEEYKSLFDKATMDKIIRLREEIDLELFLGMDKDLQESTAVEIAKRLNAKEQIDYNYLRTIKDKTGIDIESIANDLADIVAAYPYTMEHGLAYICDKEVVEELGLSEEYKKLFDKERMDKVVKLREESDLDLFLGMDINLQESAAKRIAELINANERMDYNYLRTIKEKTGIDIEAIAKELRELQRKPDEE